MDRKKGNCCQICGEWILLATPRYGEKNQVYYVCEDCYSPLVPKPREKNRYPTMPRSDQQYHGENFAIGEW